MASLNTIIATTETEALNTMLAVIGESPVSDIDTATAADAVMAVAILKETIREILSEGWAFNMEWGYELEATTTQDWTGTDETTATLGVFEVPSNLLAFHMSQNSDQQGNKYTDAVARVGRDYDQTKVIFYDRATNRDGWDTGDRTYLYIDCIWSMNWFGLPQSIRHYITIVAARRLAARAVASETLVRFTERDELTARRLAKRDQGLEDNYNMLDNAGVSNILGLRWRKLMSQGVTDTRDSTGGTGV
jgi:hypothetical protein